MRTVFARLVVLSAAGAVYKIYNSHATPTAQDYISFPQAPKRSIIFSSNAFNFITNQPAKQLNGTSSKQTITAQDTSYQSLSIFIKKNLSVGQLKEFISNGGDPFAYYGDIADPIFATIGWPLLYLTKNKNKAAVDCLLTYSQCNPWVKEDVNANNEFVKNRYDKSSDRDLLFYACLHGWNDIVIKLVTARPEVMQKTYKYNYYGVDSVLGLTLLKSNVALANELIDLGANVAKYTASQDKTTTLMGAAGIGDLALVKRILETKMVNVNAKNIVGNTALHYCIEENNELLIVDGEGEGDELLSPGKTPEVRYAILNLLLAHGANPVVHGMMNEAFPALLMRVGTFDLFKEMLNNFPEMIYMKTGRGATLLHAAAANSKEITEYMLQKLPHLLDEQDSNGYTPLMWAVRSGKKANVELLLQHGADPTVEAIGHREIMQFALAMIVKHALNDLHIANEADKYLKGKGMTVKQFRAKYPELTKLVLGQDSYVLDTASNIARTEEIKQLIDDAAKVYVKNANIMTKHSCKHIF